MKFALSIITLVLCLVVATVAAFQEIVSVAVVFSCLSFAALVISTFLADLSPQRGHQESAGDCLRSFRELSHQRLSEVARGTGLSMIFISEIETDAYPISLKDERVKKLMKYYLGAGVE